MSRGAAVRFCDPRLQKEFCPKCGDVALFRAGVCVRTGCGHRIYAAIKGDKGENLRLVESWLKRSTRDYKDKWT